MLGSLNMAEQVFFTVLLSTKLHSEVKTYLLLRARAGCARRAPEGVAY